MCGAGNIGDVARYNRDYDESIRLIRVSNSNNKYSNTTSMLISMVGLVPTYNNLQELLIFTL
jgi:hypothetical protein